MPPWVQVDPWEQKSAGPAHRHGHELTVRQWEGCGRSAEPIKALKHTGVLDRGTGGLWGFGEETLRNAAVTTKPWKLFHDAR